MKLIDNTAWIYTGGGITKDSNPQQEWEEIQNKQSTIKNAL
jgi:isochorismate synthase